MNAGTAKPDATQLAAVKHHFINSLSIHDPYSAGQFEADCLQKLDELFKKYKVVVMAGGSGLFIQAVIQGFSSRLPKADADLRKQLNELALPDLQEEIKRSDPLFAATSDLQNTRRLIRAIEVIRQTGKPFSSLKAEKPKPRNFDHILVCPDWERSRLYQRIDARVDQMMQNGLQEEALSLLPWQHLPALKTVGYSEWFLHFKGVLTPEETIRLIKQNSRRYAKRQLTWFRNQHQTVWVSPENTEALSVILHRFVNH